MFSPLPKTNRPRRVDYSSRYNLEDCLVLTDKPQMEKEPDKYPVLAKIEPPESKDTDRICAVIDNALSVDECNAIISRAEEAGFKPALLNVGGGREVLDEDVRSSDRCIIDDERFADLLFKRLCGFLPNKFTTRFGTTWNAVGLNERMRILRYSRGHYFAPHKDGSYRRNVDAGDRAGDVSFCTVMIYMNAPKTTATASPPGGFEGGSTLFLSDSDSFRTHTETPTRGTYTEVVPEAGRILVFDHRLLHEGAPVKNGVKYAIRTDLMFRRCHEN